MTVHLLVDRYQPACGVRLMPEGEPVGFSPRASEVTCPTCRAHAQAVSVHIDR